MPGAFKLPLSTWLMTGGLTAMDPSGAYSRANAPLQKGQWRAMSRRYRLLTAGLLQASGIAPVRAAIVPAANAMPRVFGGIVNLLAY
jgi:hypothetical protein